MSSRYLFLLLGLSALVALVFTGCADDPVSPNRPPDTPASVEDFESFYECWADGDVCLDSQGEDFRQFVENAPLYGIKLDQGLVNSLLEIYRSCDYYRDNAGVMRAECHDSLGNIYCPNFWLNAPFMTPIFGRESATSYCFERNASASSAFSDAFASCVNGQVNAGTLQGREGDELFRRGSQGRCVSAEQCGHIQESEGIHEPSACFYGDYSTMETGVIAEQDCASLAADHCAINCPCSGEGLLCSPCNFLSEARPVGLCAPAGARRLCNTDTDCQAESHVCVRPTEPPAWLDGWFDGLREYNERRNVGRALTRGICASRSACDSWPSNGDEFFQCGDQ